MICPRDINDPGPDPRAEEWSEKHAWFGKDAAMTGLHGAYTGGLSKKGMILTPMPIIPNWTKDLSRHSLTVSIHSRDRFRQKVVGRIDHNRYAGGGVI